MGTAALLVHFMPRRAGPGFLEAILRDGDVQSLSMSLQRGRADCIVIEIEDNLLIPFVILLQLTLRTANYSCSMFCVQAGRSFAESQSIASFL